MMLLVCCCNQPSSQAEALLPHLTLHVTQGQASDGGQRIPSLGYPPITCLCQISGKEVPIKCEFQKGQILTYENSNIRTAQSSPPSLDAMDQRPFISQDFCPQFPA